MLMDTPQNLLYMLGGAFVLGWLVAKVGSYFSRRRRIKKRDPRDDRIRSLEAELRVARGDTKRATQELEEQQGALAESLHTIEERDAVISEQQNTVEQLRADLRESVLKTRELRTELTDRAAENVKSEVKLREVETELSVAHASTDMLATGVLDYTDDGEVDPDEERTPRVVQAVSGD